MTVHLLTAISPILNDRVILVRSDDDDLNDAIGDQLVFAKSVNGLCWMIDQSQEPFLIKTVEGEVGNDEWCEDCELFFEADGDVCEVWQELIDLGFEPVNIETEDAVPDEKDGFKIPEGLKRFLKNEGSVLADFAKKRAKVVVKEQASAVGISLEDAFFDDLFEGLFGGGAAISNGVKSMSVAEAAGILAVAWPCSKEQVITGFRVMARSTHPDHGGSAEKFMRVAEARAVLMRALGEK